MRLTASSPALETEVTGQTNSPVNHCTDTHIYCGAYCETKQVPDSPVTLLPSSRLQDEGGTYRSRGVLPPDETVQDKADTKDDTRIQGSCLQEQTQVKRK